MNTETLLSAFENRLLKAGSPRPFTKWFEFREMSYVHTCGLTPGDIPQLINVALKWCDDEWIDTLDEADLGEETYNKYILLPVNAWRALAELKADDCAGPLLSILNELAREDDDWSFEELPYVLGALDPAVIPLLVAFANQTSNNVDARVVVIGALAKIADTVDAANNGAREQVIEKFNAWLRDALNKPVRFESNRDAHDTAPIRFNTAVLDGVLNLQATESAELIERAFAANQLDTGLAGDWSAVKEILNVEGLGLEMPDQPVNSMVMLRARMGFGIFSDKRLMDDGEPDEEALEEYYENAIEQFSASDEGREVIERFGSVGWVYSFLQYGANYLGETVDTMTCNDAREIVFEIIPRKVSTEAESAEAIIFELRKFWEFVERVHDCPEAKKIVKLFDHKATRELRSELANPANFGIAKSIFMKGMHARFDMTTQQGLDEFMLAHNLQMAQQQLAMNRLAHAEPPLQRISNVSKPLAAAMSATEKKAFDKKRKKQLAAKLNQKKGRK